MSQQTHKAVKQVLQAAFGLALGAAAASAQAASVQIEAPQTLHVGQTIDVQVQLANPFEFKSSEDELLYFGFKLDYDLSRLKFQGFSVAAGWDDDSGFLAPGEFGGSHFPGVANQAQPLLNLAQLRFELLGAGSAELKLSSVAGNLNHGLGYALSQAQPIQWASTLQISAPVPEPSRWALSLLGLCALAGWQRRTLQAAR